MATTKGLMQDNFLYTNIEAGAIYNLYDKFMRIIARVLIFK